MDGTGHILCKYDPKVKVKVNKMLLRSWVAHLTMTVYKGIGEHSSSQSPAMNYDRSAVSLRFNIGCVYKINRM